MGRPRRCQWFSQRTNLAHRGGGARSRISRLPWARVRTLRRTPRAPLAHDHGAVTKPRALCRCLHERGLSERAGAEPGEDRVDRVDRRRPRRRPGSAATCARSGSPPAAPSAAPPRADAAQRRRTPGPRRCAPRSPGPRRCSHRRPRRTPARSDRTARRWPLRPPSPRGELIRFDLPRTSSVCRPRGEIQFVAVSARRRTPARVPGSGCRRARGERGTARRRTAASTSCRWRR